MLRERSIPSVTPINKLAIELLDLRSQSANEDPVAKSRSLKVLSPSPCNPCPRSSLCGTSGAISRSLTMSARYGACRSSWRWRVKEFLAMRKSNCDPYTKPRSANHVARKPNFNHLGQLTCQQTSRSAKPIREQRTRSKASAEERQKRSNFKPKTKSDEHTQRKNSKRKHI